MKYTLTAALALCASCASSPSGEGWTATTNAQRVTWQNNTPAWAISCGRADVPGCYARAKDVCPGGYTMLRDTPPELLITCN